MDELFASLKASAPASSGAGTTTQPGRVVPDAAAGGTRKISFAALMAEEEANAEAERERQARAAASTFAVVNARAAFAP
eukprot:CAMPEP_0181374492 /NCGR_PEP_ID=MMETSP1106-20121128/16058_1 /TAXON_ID=81844 /ORGANISM="Mantoniella antarctica, Strain SL-175" /LENGTH=78 /DNA_ID=CAMNT_0023492495 /DNA_START=81 /DNA_END=313 /DNA_ORIENTATION=+